VPALRWFGSLTIEERETLVVALETATPAASIPELSRIVATSLGREVFQVRMIADLLAGLASLLSVFGTGGSGLPGAASIFAKTAFSADKPSESDLSVLKDQLQRLLSCEHSIGITGKAQEIMWGHGQNYRDAHVVSQIRPVFYHDATRFTESAVIIHELRLDLRQGGQDSSFHLTIDSSGILKLRDVLQRALDKEENLRASRRFEILNSIGGGE